MRIAGEKDFEVRSARDIEMAIEDFSSVVTGAVAFPPGKSYKFKIMFDLED